MERRQRFAAIEGVHDCSDPHQLTVALKRITARVGAVDRVFGVLEQLQLAVAEARDALGIEGMGAEIIRRFRDKSVMKQTLRAAGVPCARYCRAESLADALGFANTVGYPLIVKPVDGLGSRSTTRVANERALAAALAIMHPTSVRPVQIEEFVVGTEHSFETVTIDGRHIWSSSTDYIPGPLEVLENPWIQYCVVLPREIESLGRFVDVNHAALDALGMRTGLTHMEWFRRHDGTVAVNEVGARPPGVNIMPLMGLAHGVDMTQAWIRLMALDAFEPPVRTRAAGTAFLRGQGRGTKVVAVHGVAQVLEEVRPYLVEFSPPRPGQPRGDGYEGEGYAIVAAATTVEVHRALARLIRGIRVELG
jgi:biotin carboxylase